MQYRASLLVRVIAVAFGVVTTTPALANFGDNCPSTGCIYDPLFEGGDDGSALGVYQLDYTVPADGLNYRWTIRYTSEDPGASLFLTKPTQTDIFYTVRTLTGFVDEHDGNPPFRFNETVAPGLTAIDVRAPRQFNFCANPGPVGQRCAAYVEIFGNGTQLIAKGTALITARFSETAVPETAAWALMLVGFAGVGGAMRRKRSAVVAA